MSLSEFRDTLARWGNVDLETFHSFFTRPREKSSDETQGGFALDTTWQTKPEFTKWIRHQTVTYAEVPTTFGLAWAFETELGVISFTYDEGALLQLQAMYPDTNFVQGFGKESQPLREYFKTKKMPQKPVSLHLVGTDFQHQVWQALQSIAYGQLVTYADIAQAIDKPKALRAVGTAIGMNPIAYFIPCHRVINRDGKMGKYRWGSVMKKAMNLYEFNNKLNNPNT